MPAAIQTAVKKQHQAHSTWTYQLHHDNLVVLAEQEEAGDVPSA